ILQIEFLAIFRVTDSSAAFFFPLLSANQTANIFTMLRSEEAECLRFLLCISSDNGNAPPLFSVSAA
ncbi:MAG: hypothetical protein IJD81_01885, partial [Oscillospiraceae bacterium]|nr:hypothetical protein [Oscillospiraceae bacterium]